VSAPHWDLAGGQLRASARGVLEFPTYLLEPSEPAKAAIGKRVTVVDYPDGRLAIRYRGIDLAYRTFDKLRQVDQGIADNKRLGAVLAMDPRRILASSSPGSSNPRNRWSAPAAGNYRWRS
jgi:hypothetical protein